MEKRITKLEDGLTDLKEKLEEVSKEAAHGLKKLKKRVAELEGQADDEDDDDDEEEDDVSDETGDGED